MNKTADSYDKSLIEYIQAGSYAETGRRLGYGEIARHMLFIDAFSSSPKGALAAWYIRFKEGFKVSARILERFSNKDKELRNRADIMNMAQSLSYRINDTAMADSIANDITDLYRDNPHIANAIIDILDGFAQVYDMNAGHFTKIISAFKHFSEKPDIKPEYFNGLYLIISGMLRTNIGLLESEFLDVLIDELPASSINESALVINQLMLYLITERNAERYTLAIKLAAQALKDQSDMVYFIKELIAEMYGRIMEYKVVDSETGQETAVVDILGKEIDTGNVKLKTDLPASTIEELRETVDPVPAVFRFLNEKDIALVTEGLDDTEFLEVILAFIENPYLRDSARIDLKIAGNDIDKLYSGVDKDNFSQEPYSLYLFLKVMSTVSVLIGKLGYQEFLYVVEAINDGTAGDLDGELAGYAGLISPFIKKKSEVAGLAEKTIGLAEKAEPVLQSIKAVA
ncbi:hypothetical protein ACFLTD_04740, partial [Elusimicrobiota bacterium]